MCWREESACPQVLIFHNAKFSIFHVDEEEEDDDDEDGDAEEDDEDFPTDWYWPLSASTFRTSFSQVAFNRFKFSHFHKILKCHHNY